MSQTKDHVVTRIATAADTPALRLVAAHADGSARWAAEIYDRIFSSESSPRLVLVLQQDEVVLGFVVVLCCGSEWEIENIAVTHSARRRGLGMRLIVETLDQAASASVEKVFLEVRASNSAARSLYEKCAFVERGRRPAYYDDPVEEAIIYCFDFADGRPIPKVTDCK